MNTTLPETAQHCYYRRMIDPQTAAVIIAVFLLAGAVKGVIGLGLPTVSLGLLTAWIDLPTAMALLLAPSFATNLWQACIGGNTRALVRRLWPFFLLATGSIWMGAIALRHLSTDMLTTLLGLVLILYAGTNLAGLRPSITPERERWCGPLLGALNGILTGMTGSFVVPGVMFLQAIGLPRDQLIQAMGMLFTLSTLGLGLALHGNDFLTIDLGLQSAASLLPALVGMMAGQRLRKRLSENTFRRIFFAALLALGAGIVWRGL